MAQQHPIDASKTGELPGIVANAQGGFGIQAMSGSDDFNRPDSGDLGAGWSLQSGAIGIDTNRATSLASLSMSVINGVNHLYSDSVMSADVEMTSSNVFYIALVAGYADISNNVFVKVQDNTSDGLLDRVFFYYGNNGGAWNSASYYFDLAVPTATCGMRLSFDATGDTAILEIDNHTSGSTETFSSSGLLSVAGGLGDGFGIGTFGTGFADNYSVNNEGPILSYTGSPGGSMSFTTSGATASGQVALIWADGQGSFVIPNGLPCAGTQLGLIKPRGYTIQNADAGGTMVYSQFVPVGAIGLIHLQSLDLSTCVLSNIISL